MIRLVHRIVGFLFRSRARQVQTVGTADDWQALQAINRIKLAHWQARQAMRAEAARWQDGERWSS